jgi:hypothetical protein
MPSNSPLPLAIGSESQLSASVSEAGYSRHPPDFMGYLYFIIATFFGVDFCYTFHFHFLPNHKLG